ncbi:glutaredoxin family protein [Pseudogracilibacillus sp. ICA-222130]|uniref:glutaredoxin family protein n=1 Tax=Pseudogracilibacillus sp. ICA-222130 TaxID=3134655 RepID=UPI0030BA4107
MKKVQFFTKENCLLCDEAEALLEAMQAVYPFSIEKIDIYEDDALLEKYQIEIPVVKIGEIELNSTQLTFENMEAILLEMK